MSITRRVFTAFRVISTIVLATTTAWSEPKDIRWGTGPVGSGPQGDGRARRRAQQGDAGIPHLGVAHPGAVGTVKGFATKEIDGYYGSDSCAERTRVQIPAASRVSRRASNVQPVQSFWSNTIEVGLAIKRQRQGQDQEMGRSHRQERLHRAAAVRHAPAARERGLGALGVKHIYKQVDLATAGSQLESGAIDAMIIYTRRRNSPPPWLAEASLAADWAALNPSADGTRRAQEATGFAIVEVESDKRSTREVHATGRSSCCPSTGASTSASNVSTDEMYKMLTIIEKHAAELAKTRPDLHADRPRHEGLSRSRRRIDLTTLVPIHPGLAKWMREKGVWDAKWDSKIAKATM